MGRAVNLLLVEPILNVAQIEMLELRKTVVQQVFLCLDELFPSIETLIECNLGRFVRETSQLKGFGDSLVLGACRARHAIIIELDHVVLSRRI